MGYRTKLYGLFFLTLGLTANATQVHHRPANFNQTHNQNARDMLETRATGKMHAGYFTNWYVRIIVSLFLSITL